MDVKKLIAVNVASLVVLVGGGLAGYHFYDQSVNYIKTDYAKVEGHRVAIVSPASGKLVHWGVQSGKDVTKDDVLGSVSLPAPTKEDPSKETLVDIKAPTNGTIVSNTGMENSLVSAGTPLASSYDYEELWVKANVKETKLKDIEIGQEVDLYVDAFEGTVLKGEVQEIGLATASESSLLPTGNANANYTKVVQVVPVKISIKDKKGQDILPGMNVSVRIHK